MRGEAPSINPTAGKSGGLTRSFPVMKRASFDLPKQEDVAFDLRAHFRGAIAVVLEILLEE